MERSVRAINPAARHPQDQRSALALSGSPATAAPSTSSGAVQNDPHFLEFHDDHDHDHAHDNEP